MGKSFITFNSHNLLFRVRLPAQTQVERVASCQGMLSLAHTQCQADTQAFGTFT